MECNNFFIDSTLLSKGVKYMKEVNISFDLVGESLEEDIYSDQGVLLLKKGTTLLETHVLLYKITNLAKQS